MKDARTFRESTSAQDQGHSNPKSTTTSAQRNRILEALRIGPQTTYDLRRLGCYQAPTRIIELRRMGYDIVTELVTIWDRDGYRHDRVARYSFPKEDAQ